MPRGLHARITAWRGTRAHRLCNYIYDLAVAFSGFCDQCPVVTAPTNQGVRQRLRLCDLTRRVLEDALHTLGIPTVDRM